MELSFVELRRNPKRILEALARHEEITLTRRGKSVARILPLQEDESKMKVEEHPAFGMWSEREDLSDPAEYVRKLREPRYDDV